MSEETALAKASPIANNGRGLVLSSIDDMWRFATCIAKSGTAPKGMNDPSTLVVAMQMGYELGLSPMASIQNIAVINNRPSIWGDGMLAVCQGSQQFDHSAFIEEWSGDGDKHHASCTVRRKGGALVTRTFSVADAKRAGLWGKSGPWTTNPDRMLQMRARSFALRDAFADVLRGFDCGEEVRDIPADTVRVEQVETQSKTAALAAKLRPQPIECEPDAEPEDNNGDLFNG